MTDSGWAKLVLIDLPENIEAVEMAIELISGSEPSVTHNEEIILSLRKGQQHVESLIGRKLIEQDNVLPLDEDSKAAMDSFLLRGR
jgi:hypothetical protein